MSDLGDLLVLLHGARGRITTVRAVVRTWHDQRVAGEAMDRSGFTGYAPMEVPDDEIVQTSEVRVWYAAPDRIRLERDGAHVTVRRGELWWEYDPDGGAFSNEGDTDSDSDTTWGIGEELNPLLNPAPAIGLLDFGAIEPGVVAGRTTRHVRAELRDAGNVRDMPLLAFAASGADELVLDADAERGILLRIECRLGGRPFTITEMVEIAYDEAIPDDTFVFTPPPGETLRSMDASFPMRDDLTIEEAVALAPFTVWVPARVPAGWGLDVRFNDAYDRPPVPPGVQLEYRAANATHGVDIAQTPADHPNEFEDDDGRPWRAVERDGRSMEVRDGPEDWQSADLRLVLDGTRVAMQSYDLAVDVLVELAAGLVRASSEPPRFGP